MYLHPRGYTYPLCSLSSSVLMSLACHCHNPLLLPTSEISLAHVSHAITKVPGGSPLSPSLSIPGHFWRNHVCAYMFTECFKLQINLMGGGVHEVPHSFMVGMCFTLIHNLGPTVILKASQGSSGKVRQHLIPYLSNPDSGVICTTSCGVCPASCLI